MRTLVFAIAAVAAAALATTAMAGPGGADQVSNAFANPPNGANNGLVGDPAESQVNLRESYDLSIMMLKKKMERLTREDGGALTAAHQASLQKDLDAVNRRYHAGRFAQR